MSRLHRPAVLALCAALFASPFCVCPARAQTTAQLQTEINTLQSQVAALQTAMTAQQQKTAALTVTTDTTRSDKKTNTEMTLTGVNLHVVSGAGSTAASPNGLGNVIIGYNEARTGSSAVNTRTGSHNLILGAGSNYSSYGGIIAGYANAITAPYAGVTGGRSNTASASYASVGGGYDNTASGVCSAVTGGEQGTADGEYASVTGGLLNTAGGVNASVSGGYANTASGGQSSVSGGAANTAMGQISSVSGGDDNTSGGEYASVSGGADLNAGLEYGTAGGLSPSQSALLGLFTLTSGVGTNTELTLSGVNLHIVNGLGATNGEPSSPLDMTKPVVNGLGNLIIGYNVTRADDPNIARGIDARTGSHCLILGDENNYTSYGGVVAGDYDTVSAPYAGVFTGYRNTAGASASSVSGGARNTAGGVWSSVSGGLYNTASGNEASVSGGSSSTASGEASSVSGGGSSTAAGQFSSVSGGQSNTAGGETSSVSGGAGVIDSTSQGWAAGGLHYP